MVFHDSLVDDHYYGFLEVVYIVSFLNVLNDRWCNFVLRYVECTLAQPTAAWGEMGEYSGARRWQVLQG